MNRTKNDFAQLVVLLKEQRNDLARIMGEIANKARPDPLVPGADSRALDEIRALAMAALKT